MQSVQKMKNVKLSPLPIKLCLSCSLVLLSTGKNMKYSRYGLNENVSCFHKNCLNYCPILKNSNTSIRLSTSVASLNKYNMDLLEILSREFFILQARDDCSPFLNFSSSELNYFIPVECEKNCFQSFREFDVSSGNEKSSEASRSNWNKKPFRVAAVQNQEYAYDTSIQLKNGSYVFEDSFAVELLNCLELTLNFTTMPVITKFWGHLLPNQTWTGMIALLLEDKADLGLSSTADKSFRRAVIDYNIPTTEICLSAFFEKPPAISSKLSALLKPFQPEFWIVLLFAIIGMGLTSLTFLKVLCKLQPLAEHQIDLDVEKKSHLSQEFDEDSIMWNSLDCVFWPISTISLQGFYKVPSELPCRVIMMVGCVTGILTYSSYAGTLVSFLSVVTEPIQNLGQLVATDFTFVVVQESLALKFLSESPDTKTVNLYQRRAQSVISSMKDAHDEIVKGQFVFVCINSEAYESFSVDFTPQEACRIREVQIENSQQKTGTLIQKNSPYKRIIDYQILRMIQHGLVRRWNSKYLKSKPACDIRSEYEGVQLGSVVLAFILLFGGFLSGFLALLAELSCYAKIRNKHKHFQSTAKIFFEYC